MKRFGLLREPLVHFMIGGAMLFALQSWMGSNGDQPSYRVDVDAGQIQRLREAWAAQSGRLPTKEELSALIEDQVREEIFYREALRRGLDQNDVLVRRRLAQKLTFLIEDLAAVDQPGDKELRRYHDEHADRYVDPARISFRHAFFSRDRRADAAADAAAALQKLKASGAHPSGPEVAALGDPFMLHSEYAGRTHQEVRELFGPEFADAVFALKGDDWQGPVASSYGEHLVQVVGRTPERQPPFEEVKEAVLRDFAQDRREQANAKAYHDMRSRYQVVVAETPPDREARREPAP